MLCISISSLQGFFIWSLIVAITMKLSISDYAPNLITLNNLYLNLDVLSAWKVELARDCYTSAVEGDPYSYVALQAWGVLEVCVWVHGCVCVWWMVCKCVCVRVISYPTLPPALSRLVFSVYPCIQLTVPLLSHNLRVCRLTVATYQVPVLCSAGQRSSLPRAHTHSKLGRH